ncbi:MAG TPA: ABC transporter permease [Clostridia bacterium]|nr:ABC transporter permease [Clostridia bacterium]
MGMRRLAAIAAIIVFALGSYSYMIGKYNPDTVEFHFSENIPGKDYEKIRENNRDVFFSMNYIMRHQGNKLIITTGLDYLTKDLRLCKGSFLADMNMKEAVIGDMAAGKYFRSSSVIGQLINVYGEEYKVKGIIKGSNEVYIPYSDKLSSLSWQKRIIRCSISDKKHFYLQLEKLQNQLEAFGVEILDVVIYREELNSYKNIAILAASYILAYYLFILARRIKAGLTKLEKGYLENFRVYELSTYLLNKAGDLAAAAGLCIIVLTMAYAIYKLISNLYILPSMIPDNLFSPSSYINAVGLLYRRYLTRLENGIDGILVDIKIVNAVFVLLILAIFMIALDFKRRRSAAKIK